MIRLRSIVSSVSVSVCFCFCRVKYHGAAGNSVIRALPLALDFNATLRCAMAKSRVVSGQRAVTIFAQNHEPDGRLFVGGWVGHFICKAAGEAVFPAFPTGHPAVLVA